MSAAGRRGDGAAPARAHRAGSAERFDDQARLVAILHERPESGWGVALFEDLDGRELRATGRVLHLREGEVAHLCGRWTTAGPHGRQLRVEQALPSALADLGSEEAFVAGTLHVGRDGAAAIAAAVGEAPLIETVRRDPDRWLAEAGLEGGRLREAVADWDDRIQQYELRLLLQACGAPEVLAHIVETMGPRAYEAVEEDPYLLAERFGVPVAALGPVLAERGWDDEARAAEALVVEVLREAAERHHTAIERDELLRRATARIGDAAAAADALERIACRGAAVARGPLVQPRLLAAQEAELAARFAELAAERHALRLRGEPAAHLTDDQRAAVRAAFGQRLTIVTGGPGTGKSTLVAEIVALARRARLEVELCAPTGKAAERLEALSGAPASTIHALARLAIREAGQPRDWTADEDHYLAQVEEPSEPADIVVCDEASMLTCELALAVLSRVGPETHLVLVGDMDQLAPTGVGAVFEDLIGAGLDVVELSRVMRQDGASAIPAAASAVLAGRRPRRAEPADGARDDFFVKVLSTDEEVLAYASAYGAGRAAARLGVDPLWDVQVVAATNDEVDRLNRELQQALNPAGRPVADGEPLRVGDKVRFAVNDPELGVVNGTFGVIRGATRRAIRVAVDAGERRIEVPARRLRVLELAYAVTVHRAQGSEFPAVIVAAAAPSRVLSRNWLYTAITRARELCLVFVRADALDHALRRTQVGERRTTLADRLRELGVVAAGAGAAATPP
jgi:exodeoxyribonuclease V alpha subunit